MGDTDRRLQDPVVIALSGELDDAKAEALGEALCQAIEWTRQDTTVDLTAVPLIDSLTMAASGGQRQTKSMLTIRATASSPPVTD